MPWVNITVSEPCAPEKQVEIKAGLAAILQELMNKQEQGLVVTFTTALGFYRGGAACHDAAVVDLRYIGEFPLAVKRELTRRVAGLLQAVLGVNPLKVSLVITEVESQNWGRNAGDFS